MNLQEVVEEKFNELVDAMVQERFAKFVANEPTAAATVLDSPAFREGMAKLLENRVANEIGNRLRCGIWDGRKVDEAFQQVWEQEAGKALSDRIRQAIRDIIRTEVKDELVRVFRLVQRALDFD